MVKLAAGTSEFAQEMFINRIFTRFNIYALFVKVDFIINKS